MILDSAITIGIDKIENNVEIVIVLEASAVSPSNFSANMTVAPADGQATGIKHAKNNGPVIPISFNPIIVRMGRIMFLRITGK